MLLVMKRSAFLLPSFPDTPVRNERRIEQIGKHITMAVTADTQSQSVVAEGAVNLTITSPIMR